VIPRGRFTLVLSLLLSFVVSATVGSTAVVASAQALAPGPRVALGSDAKNRYIRIGGPGTPVYPTIDLTCDGKRWTLALTRSEDGGV
jgi:hypothetical protein